MKPLRAAMATARLAPACLLLLTAQAWADYTVRLVTPFRWGLSPGAVGLADCTLEDFEDTALAPGLSLTWSAPAGTVGPVTTLPRTFACATDDPFGSAFAGGAWNGTRGLISALGNQTYNYSASQNWGDLEIGFAVPQRVVGFSLQQADAEVTLVINGTPVGGLTSLAGASMNGQRAGFFVVTASGTDTISTLKLDNTGGDGFVLDSLLYSPNPAPTVSVTGFPHVPWPRPDKELGITPVFTEDFEDTALAAGLQIGWESLAGSAAPSPTLPGVFDPVTQDVFGDAFDTGPWDGARCVINTRDNASHAYTGTGEWGDIVFRFEPPRQSVSFSFEQAEAPVRLLINGRDVGSLLSLAGLSTGGGRQGYIRLDTPCGGTPISELRLNNNINGPSGDGFAIDHMMAGTPISFPTGPFDAAVCNGVPAQFAVTVAGVGPFSYLWQIETSPGVWQTMGNDPGPLPGGGAAFATPLNSPTVNVGVLNRSGPFNVRALVSNSCATVATLPARIFIDPADLGSTGGVAAPDDAYDNNDFVVFIDFFFNHDARADIGRTGGLFGHDGAWDNNDFVVFIDRFFQGC